MKVTPAFFVDCLYVVKDEVHWLQPSLELLPGQSEQYSLRFRYRQKLQTGTLVMTEEGLYLDFDTPQRGIAAGQFATWYKGDSLVGSGPIA